MKSGRLSWLALALLEAGFLVFVGLSALHLPERVASHFDTAGTANGWMRQSTYVRFIAAFGLCFPLFWALGLPLLLRFTPVSLWNLPHRGYWLAPERRSATEAYLAGQFRWFACLTVGFTTGVHASVVLANTATPPHLAGPAFGAVTGVFLAAGAAWTLVFWRHFARGPRP
jgi:hypothetical protein